MEKTATKKLVWLAVVGFMVLSSTLLAADGPKIFVESISQPHQVDSLIFRGHTTTNGEMRPASEIERILTKMCSECSFVTKQDKADYVLTFSNTSSGYEYSVADNSGDGKRIDSGKPWTSPYDKAIKAVRKHWAKKASQ